MIVSIFISTHDQDDFKNKKEERNKHVLLHILNQTKGGMSNVKYHIQ